MVISYDIALFGIDNHSGAGTHFRLRFWQFEEAAKERIAEQRVLFYGGARGNVDDRRCDFVHQWRERGQALLAVV